MDQSLQPVQRETLAGVTGRTRHHRCQPPGLGHHLESADGAGNVVCEGSQVSDQSIRTSSDPSVTSSFWSCITRTTHPHTNRQCGSQSPCKQIRWDAILSPPQGSASPVSLGRKSSGSHPCGARQRPRQHHSGLAKQRSDLPWRVDA